MPPKKPAPKKAPKTAPQNYHCFVCGMEHSKDEEGAKPVSWDKGAGGAAWNLLRWPWSFAQPAIAASVSPVSGVSTGLLD